MLFHSFIVSIHASVKDATVWTITVIVKDKVSIHASVKDATEKQREQLRVEYVSIHASVKDATAKLQIIRLPRRMFQSTHL